ncbi:type II toxin-antitoxin system VapC family toxin [Laspinema olomoucense]|uniref:type II toxin-antitoxin system VapC family toxin n=1 Tax=Laspinema olomoucense TaxID=3231600 RepID=UPI0021BB1A35|nr:PIN domain-containing protein [Laspinema sp. D3c]MCT7995053.1 PIN domain-containing protein [Laspinema sp. D3c]
MRRRIILDTGPLAALLNKRDTWHEWLKQELAQVKPPLLTCESVISEACFLLKNLHNDQESVIFLLNNGTIQIPFRLNEEAASIQELSRRYQSIPMSLADACIVRMAELYPDSVVLTLDSDFTIYRKNRNQEIPVIMPPS